MKMVNRKTKEIVDVKMHITTMANSWEYYITKFQNNREIGYGLVHGFEAEWGTFYMEDLDSASPVISRENKLNQLMPAIGWEWVGNEK